MRMRKRMRDGARVIDDKMTYVDDGLKGGRTHDLQ